MVMPIKNDEITKPQGLRLSATGKIILLCFLIPFIVILFWSLFVQFAPLWLVAK